MVIATVQVSFAQPAISLFGPFVPNQLACPAGSGMAASTVVDVFFDVNQVAKTASDASGNWRVCFSIPANASPGEHSVVAVDLANNAALNDLFISAPWAEVHRGSMEKSANPSENQLNRSNVSGLLLDRIVPGFGTGVITGITVVDGNLAFTSTDGIGGADAFRGPGRELLWQLNGTSTPPSQPVAPLVTFSDDGTSLIREIFFGTTTGLVGRVEITDSFSSKFTPVWQQPAGTVSFTGAPAGNFLCVLFPSGDGHLYCLVQSSGGQLWAAALGGKVGSPTCPDNVNIYVANSTGKLFRLNSSGKTLFSVAAAANMSPPVFVNTLLLITRTDGKVEALSPTNLAVVWTTAAPVSPFVGSVAVIGQTAYGVTTNGTVYAINLADGTFAWHVALGGGYSRGPAVSPGLVYLTAAKRLVVLRSDTGALLFSTITSASITAGPVVSDGAVYIGTSDNQVLQYDLNPSGGGQQQPQVQHSIKGEQAGTLTVMRREPMPAKSVDLDALHRDPSMPITPYGGTAH
jgi:outer membrane protein assembly factor BamB